MKDSLCLNVENNHGRQDKPMGGKLGKAKAKKNTNNKIEMLSVSRGHRGPLRSDKPIAVTVRAFLGEGGSAGG